MRAPTALPARAGRDLPAPDAAPARAARAQRRRLRRARLRRGRARRWGRWRTCARWPATCGRRAWRCAWTSCSTTPRRSTNGRRRPTSTGRSRTGRSPTPTSARCPRSSPTPRPGASRRVGDRWVWTTFNGYQWDLDYTNPDVFVAMASAMLALANVGVDVLRLDAAPFLWKRVGHQLPEPARGPRAAAGLPGGDADRRARGRLQGRGDRRPRRPRPLPGDGQARGQGVRPRLPQRAHGAAVERAGVRAAWR